MVRGGTLLSSRWLISAVARAAALSTASARLRPAFINAASSQQRQRLLGHANADRGCRSPPAGVKRRAQRRALASVAASLACYDSALWCGPSNLASLRKPQRDRQNAIALFGASLTLTKRVLRQASSGNIAPFFCLSTRPVPRLGFLPASHEHGAFVKRAWVKELGLAIRTPCRATQGGTARGASSTRCGRRQTPTSQRGALPRANFRAGQRTELMPVDRWDAP